MLGSVRGVPDNRHSYRELTYIDILCYQPMSRPLRIEYPDAWYHVMSRARMGQLAFPAKEDYFSFIDLLKDTAEMFNIRLAAYCLMTTHYLC